MTALEELLGQSLQVQNLRLLDLLRGRDERLDRSSNRGGVRRRLRHLHRRSIGRRKRVQLMLGQEVLQLLQGNHLGLLLRDLGELLNLLHLGLVLRHRRLLLSLLLLLLLALLLGLRLLLLLLLGGSYGRSLLLLDSLLMLLHLLGRLDRRLLLSLLMGLLLGLLVGLLLLMLLLLLLLQHLLCCTLGLRGSHNCRVEFIALQSLGLQLGHYGGTDDSNLLAGR